MPLRSRIRTGASLLELPYGKLWANLNGQNDERSFPGPRRCTHLPALRGPTVNCFAALRLLLHRLSGGVRVKLPYTVSPMPMLLEW